MSEQINYQTDVNDVKKQLENYEKEKETKTSKQKREDVLKKMFIPRETKEVFRILPPKRNRNFYEIAYFHSIQTNTSAGNKKWSKIYCPKHNDPKVPKLDSNDNPVVQENGEPIMLPAPCALCDKHKEILATQDDSIKYKKREELNNEQKKIFDNNKRIFMQAKQYEASKFYIVKGIDRSHMNHGPKFWRFKDSYTNRGTMDKLKSVLSDYIETQKKDFMSPTDGTDLSIIMGDAKTPAGRPYKDISAIQTRGPSPLHEDTYYVNTWLGDESTWRDAFKPRSAPNITEQQYLEMLAKGNDPYYDEIDKKWLFPGNPELEKMANTRDRNLDSENKEFEQASDLYYSGVNINNVTEKDVGEFEDDSLDISSEFKDKPKSTENNALSSKDDNSIDDDDYDDLPF